MATSNTQVHTPAPTPSRAIYGLALYLSCRALFVLYLVWAFLPEKWLSSIGFDFLPSKYWAVAIPVLACTTLAAVGFFIYPCLGLVMNPTPESLESYTPKEVHPLHHFRQRSFPTKHFVPTSEVCRMLYSYKVSERSTTS